MARAFSVELAGCFHTFKLLDAKGREITDLRGAADFAESEFGVDWQCVYNGDAAMDRDEYTGCAD